MLLCRHDLQLLWSLVHHHQNEQVQVLTMQCELVNKLRAGHTKWQAEFQHKRVRRIPLQPGLRGIMGTIVVGDGRGYDEFRSSTGTAWLPSVTTRRRNVSPPASMSLNPIINIPCARIPCWHCCMESIEALYHLSQVTMRKVVPGTTCSAEGDNCRASSTSFTEYLHSTNQSSQWSAWHQTSVTKIHQQDWEGQKGRDSHSIS